MSEIELKPCPNPWCEAAERSGDYSPVVRLHHFGNYRAVCTSCVLEGPLRPTKAEAAAAWNTRSQSERVSRLEEALTWIEREYENQDLNHKDFRVEAYRRARSALNQGADDGR